MVICPKDHVTGSCGVSLNSAQGDDSNDISHMWAKANRGGSVGVKFQRSRDWVKCGIVALGLMS